MSANQTIAMTLPALRTAGPTGRRRPAGGSDRLYDLVFDPVACRSRRVLLMLAILWVISVFDLHFTLLAQEIGCMYELNPLAQGYIDSPNALTAYKFALLLPATGILMLFRRKRMTEMACGALCSIHVVLALIWMQYYSALDW